MSCSVVFTATIPVCRFAIPADWSRIALTNSLNVEFISLNAFRWATPPFTTSFWNCVERFRWRGGAEGYGLGDGRTTRDGVGVGRDVDAVAWDEDTGVWTAVGGWTVGYGSTERNGVGVVCDVGWPEDMDVSIGGCLDLLTEVMVNGNCNPLGPSYGSSSEISGTMHTDITFDEDSTSATFSLLNQRDPCHIRL
jgi:hypothetical protein